MNCEKCKNKKATLFFSDEGGGRHALCAACGSTYGKAVNVIGVERGEEKPAAYLPEPTLFSLQTNEKEPFIFRENDGKRAVCRGCGLTAEEAQNLGELGCPECYIAFSSLIFPTVPTADSIANARMPSARRARLDRERILIELRAELRRAIESESFELAATIRDKIRNLEKR